MRLLLSSAAILSALLIIPIVGADAADTETILHTFAGSPDGSKPEAGLLLLGGKLYGTTSTGGSTTCPAGCGTVFELTPPAAGGSAYTETVVYQFTGGADGSDPVAGVIADAAGDLYGTTSLGGSSACSCGTVFELKPPSHGGAWTPSVLHAFAGAPDGAAPVAGLVFDKQGNLYGTTETGGIYGDATTTNGTVYKLAPLGNGEWDETVLHSFNASRTDGASPTAALILDASGNLYGTTDYGGSGIEPYSGIIGAGTAFELHKPTSGTTWNSTILHSFSNDLLDGALPAGHLVFDSSGNLYGLTTLGGYIEDGALFKLEKPKKAGKSWKKTILYDFTGKEGQYPTDGLVFSDGDLYGTTSRGGIGSGCGKNGCGVVFKFVPSSRKLTVLHGFTGENGDGATPLGDVSLDSSGNVYATAGEAGALGDGIALKLKP
jgi:uncharacterized repeat protein (TIGR03803 family)